MGYYTQVTGQITIDPPLRWVDVKDSPFLPEACDRDVALVIQRDIVQTDDGTLNHLSAVAIERATDDSYRTYSIEAHLQELLDQWGDGRSFDGYLEGHGEDNEDIWRLYVRDGKAIKAKVQLVWPEGTPG